MKTLLGLYTFNNDEFKNNFNYICLDELELKKKGENPCKTSFLNLSIINLPLLCLIKEMALS